MSDFIRPMLAQTAEHPFDDPEWLFEIKYDGYRALAKTGKTTTLYSRNNHILNLQYPHLLEDLKKISTSALLDGEIVVFDEKGRSSFQLLQNHPHEAVYIVFDLLILKGKDLRAMPLTERKRELEKFLPKKLRHIQLCDYIEDEGSAFFREIQKYQLEGIIGKKKLSRYLSKRSKDWLKIKNVQFLEALILGYSLQKRALLIGNHRKKYIGRVGTGFTEKEYERIIRSLIPDHLEKKRNETLQWVKPYQKCLVGFSEWTKDRILRHPTFIHVIKELFTNLDKIFWPKEKITKGDLIAYYRQIAPLILPYLKDRPQVLHRFPDGIEGKDFYQKKAGNLAKNMPTTLVKPGEKYLLAQDAESLLYLINLGCIELNPFNARVGSLDHPDYLVIDLDPNEVSFKTVVEVATAFRKKCEELGLKSYPKTSGKRGIHIYLPLEPKYDFETVRLFAELLCTGVHQTLPKLTTMRRNPEKRGKKVYLDFTQNRLHTPMACVYCVRPVSGALVSTPLEWREVNSYLDPSQFTIHTIHKRIDRKGDLFLNILKEKNDLSKALDKINV